MRVQLQPNWEECVHATLCTMNYVGQNCTELQC